MLKPLNSLYGCMSVRSYNGVPVTPPSETPQDAAGGDCDAQELLTSGSLV